MKKALAEFNRRKDLIREMGVFLRKRRPVIFLAEEKYEQSLCRDIDIYFSNLWQLLGSSEYSKWVKYYIDTSMASLKLQYVYFDFSGCTFPLPVPLSKSHFSDSWIVRDMPYLWESSGRCGRPASAFVKAVANILRHNRKLSAHDICVELDRQKILLDSVYCVHGVSSWKAAYKDPDLRRLIDVRVSKVRTSLNVNK